MLFTLIWSNLNGKIPDKTHQILNITFIWCPRYVQTSVTILSPFSIYANQGLNQWEKTLHIDGLGQDCSNSIADALEL